MFQSRFSDALSDIEHRINNINHVCEQLAASVAMRQVRSESFKYVTTRSQMLTSLSHLIRSSA